MVFNRIGKGQSRWLSGSKYALALFLFANLPVSTLAQKDSAAHRTRFFLLAGASWGAIDLERYNTTSPRFGFTGRAYCYVAPSVRLAGEYTYTLEHKDDPTWVKVNARSFELNAHLTGVFVNSMVGFYALTGVCMQQWKGQFTGLNDLKGFGKKFMPGESNSYTHFLGNFGVGFEKNFRHIGFFGEFKFRMIGGGDSNVKLRINDVTYSMGLKANVRVKKIGKLFRGPGDIYHWF